MSKSIDSKELIYKFCEEKNLIYGKYSDEVKSKKAKDNAEKIKNKRFEDGEFDSTKTLPVNSGCLGFFLKGILTFVYVIIVFLVVLFGLVWMFH